MPAENYKSITVDGENYRWLLKSGPDRNRGTVPAGFLIAVEHENGEGQILAARFALRSLAGLESRLVTPKDIAMLVRAGLEKGWTPRQAGPPFVIQGDEVVR
jgi:hypothetical protein